MAYRDVSESLRAYRERVAADLEEARRAAQQAAEQAAKVRVLEKELLETDGLIAKMGGTPKKLPLLDDVRVAAPCPASWEQMVGDDHVRFCGTCEKNVYNLSSLSRDEAEALLVAREGNMCVRLYRRTDGTVLTDDCPVGVKKRRRRRAVAAAVGGGMMAVAAALGAESQTTRMGDIAQATMGEPTVPVTDSTTTATAGDPLVMGQWTAGVVAIPEKEAPKPSAQPAPKAVPKSFKMGKVELGR